MGGRAQQIFSHIVVQDRELLSAMDRYYGLLLAAAVAMAYAFIITYSPRSSHLFSEQCARVAAATTRSFGTVNNTTCGNDTPALYEPLGVSYPLIRAFENAQIPREIWRCSRQITCLNCAKTCPKLMVLFKFSGS